MENKSSRANAKLAINITELQPANIFSSSKGSINTDDYVLIVEICGSFKVIPLSTKEIGLIEFDKDLLTNKIGFEMRDIKGNSFGVSDVAIPFNVMEKNETNIVDELTFASPKKEKEPVKVKLSLTFSYKGEYSAQSAKKMFKSTSKPSIEKKSSLPTKNTTGGRVSPNKRIESRNNPDTNSNEKAFQDYLHNVIARENGRLKSIVDEHNSINEIVHLNKMHNNLPFSFGENTLHIYSPQKLSTLEDEEDVVPLQNVLGNRNSVPAIITPIKKMPSGGSRETSTEKRLATTGLFSSYSREENNTPDTRREELSKTNTKDTSPRKTSPKPKRSKQDNLPPASARPRSPSPKKPQAQPAQLQSARDLQGADKMMSSKERKYKSQVEFLNQVIVNIEARLKKNDTMKQDNSKLKDDAENFYQEKKNLQENLNEAMAQFKEELVNFQKLNSNILNEKEKLLQRNEELLNKNHELEQGFKQAKLNLTHQESQVTSLSAKVEELSNANQLLEGAQKALERSEQKRAEEQKVYGANVNRFEKNNDELQSIIQELTKDKKELKVELQQTRLDLSEQKDLNTQLKLDLLMMEKKLDYAEGFRSAVKSLEDQRDEMVERLSENKKALTQAEKLVEKVNKEFAEKLKESEVRDKQQTEEIAALKEKLKTFEIKNNQLSQDIVEIESKNRELSAVKCTFQKSEFLVESMRKERDEFKERLDQVEEHKKVLNEQVDSLVQSHKEINDKALDLETTVTQLQSNLKQSDSQIQSLCQLAEEVEDENSIYLPQNNDPIDTALADYINTTQGSKGLKLLFVRECEGVYQFGSKKIYIKIEGNKILIRVGGGFLTIEEFIRQNGDLEYNKLAKNDPVKLLWRNIAINKVIVGKCVSCFDKSKTQAYTCG